MFDSYEYRHAFTKLDIKTAHQSLDSSGSVTPDCNGKVRGLNSDTGLLMGVEFHEVTASLPSRHRLFTVEVDIMMQGHYALHGAYTSTYCL